MAITVFANAFLIDCTGADPMEGAAVVVESDRIRDVLPRGNADAHQIQKINLAREQSVQGLTYAYEAGCKIGSGSDLLGDMASQRHVELELKAQVMKPMEVLLAATKVNAEIFRMADRIGTVEPGKYADLIVVDGNPLRNMRCFQQPENPRVIMKGGKLFKQTR